jgi:alcohol dehydrogenase class IV
VTAPGRWEFATAGRIMFGRGAARDAAATVAAFGTRVLVVTGATPARAEWLVEGLAALGASPTVIFVDGEPDVAFVGASASFAVRKAIGVVVSVGGGSAIDAGKAIAALATNAGDIFDYLEVVGRGRSLQAPPLPFVAIPTTAGTGSEVTRNAVLAVPDQRVKVSLRSPLMLPRVAIVDPELTYTVPDEVTAFTGLDALAQNIEPFLSPRATPLTDGLCREGIRRAARSLRAAVRDGQDAGAREDMALASLCGGLALANAGLGAVHGLAGPLGGTFAAPHGALCAALVAPVLAANVEALTAREPGTPARSRADEVAQLLTGRAAATAPDGVEWLAALTAELGIPRLSAWGVGTADIPTIVEQAARSSSMKGNPIALTPEELASIVASAL